MIASSPLLICSIGAPVSHVMGRTSRLRNRRSSARRWTTRCTPACTAGSGRRGQTSTPARRPLLPNGGAAPANSLPTSATPHIPQRYILRRGSVTPTTPASAVIPSLRPGGVRVAVAPAPVRHSRRLVGVDTGDWTRAHTTWTGATHPHRCSETPSRRAELTRYFANGPPNSGLTPSQSSLSGRGTSRIGWRASTSSRRTI